MRPTIVAFACLAAVASAFVPMPVLRPAAIARTSSSRLSMSFDPNA